MVEAPEARALRGYDGEARNPRFKPYPAYKESGVEWLGEIPAHWEVKRTKVAARLRSGHTPSRQHPEYWADCTIPWFGLADVWQIRDARTERVSETAEKISELGLANSAARLLPKGTVMLSRTASVGFSAIMGVDMATTQDFVNWVCGPSIRPEYLLYVFRSMGHEFRRLTMGSTHQTIYMPDVGRFSTSVPPFTEQDDIVAFIRKETATLDALVAEKERLIELLQEKRTALITRAVTKGLDSNVPLKDSGLAHPNYIPAHWEVVRLGRKIVLQRGEDITKDQQREGSVPVISSGGISSFHDTAVARGPGVVVGRKGSAGTVYFVECDFWPHDTTLWVKDFRANHPRYVFYVLDSLNLSSFDTGAANPTLNRNLIHPLIVSWPSVSEQHQIVAFLDGETERLDALISTVRKAIEKLAELRAALISAAVTGKIDVR